jgi:hypothetical protein
MNGKFTVTIELGNDAMRTRKTVARTLGLVADNIAQTREKSGRIRDTNGNTVGEWKFEEES